MALCAPFFTHCYCSLRPSRTAHDSLCLQFRTLLSYLLAHLPYKGGSTKFFIKPDPKTTKTIKAHCQLSSSLTADQPLPTAYCLHFSTQHSALILLPTAHCQLSSSQHPELKGQLPTADCRLSSSQHSALSFYKPLMSLKHISSQR